MLAIKNVLIQSNFRLLRDSESHGFENGVFQAECLAMIADPMGSLSKLLKCDSFYGQFFSWKHGKEVCERRES